MALTTVEADFVDETEQRMEELSNLIDRLGEMSGMWTARGYGSSIEDADLTGRDYTAAQLESTVTLANQLVGLKGNQAVIQGDYATTMNVVRRRG